MPDVLIHYEHKVREYPYYHLLIYELRRRGYSVGMCHYIFRHTWWRKLTAKPMVVVTSALGNGSGNSEPNSSFLRDRIDYLNWQAPYILNMQAEQFFSDDIAAYNLYMDENYRDRIYYVCWGDRRKHQIEKLGIEPDKAVLCGPIHMDLMRPEFYKTKEKIASQFKINPSKNWCLFVSSFKGVTSDKGRLISEFNFRRKSVQDDTLEEFYDWQRTIKQCRGIVLDWIDRFLYSHQDYVFIYRPHPGEKLDSQIRFLKETYPNNFFHIYEETVQQWMNVCENVNCWVTTVVAEAAFLNKPVNIIDPESIRTGMFPSYISEDGRIRSYEEFEAAQQLYNQDNCLKSAINREELKESYNVDNRAAYLKICDLIEQILKLPMPHNMEKSLFTRQTLKRYWYRCSAYISFYAVTGIKLSKIMPFKRSTLKYCETKLDNGTYAEDVRIYLQDRRRCNAIKRLVKINGKKDDKMTKRRFKDNKARG